MEESKKIAIITGSFPYGKGETFISQELEFLSKLFDQIKIIPAYTGGNNVSRSVPGNVHFSDPLIPENFISQLIFGIFSKSPLLPFIKEFFKTKSYKSKSRILRWFKITLGTRILLRKNLLTKEIKDCNILYFYWGTGASYCIPFIKDKKTIIVRFHGSDLYEEGNPLFFRNDILKKITHPVFISENGFNYIKNKYPEHIDKAKVFRLGTLDQGLGFASTDGTLRILSCSIINNNKRVTLICQALKNITNKKIIWTHIGNGPQLKKLLKEAKKLPENIQCNFTGYWPHSKIMSFYKNNPIDIFINVSYSEGLPVSIMEAMSFGIPSIGTDTGGTSEIITNQNGYLLNKNLQVKDLTSAILNFSEINLNEYRNHARLTWENYFNANENSYRFAVFLKSLTNE